jgi:adenine-specific DNA-methyltransferase
MNDEDQVQKLVPGSPDFQTELAQKISEIAPEIMSDGKLDVNKLRDLVNGDAETSQERFGLFWPGKQRAQVVAQMPTSATLKPAKEESVDWDNTKNIFIEGDNLEVLKALQNSYRRKVKMIYIDPPYNTGEEFIYPDNFQEGLKTYLEYTGQTNEAGENTESKKETGGRKHSNWLSMMYPRMQLAKSLLKEDGLLAVHIDEHENTHLKLLLDEVFGQNNFAGEIIWNKKNPKGDAKGIAYQHECLYIYAKNFEAVSTGKGIVRAKANAKTIINKAKEVIKNDGVTHETRIKFKDWLNKQNFSGGEKAYRHIDDNGEVYRTVSMAWPNKKRAPDDYFIPLIHPVTNKPCPVPDRGWRNPPATMKQLQENGLIIFGKDESKQPERKYLLRENMEENVSSIFEFGGSDDALFKELGLTFDNPKPVDVATAIISWFTSKEKDTVMDFFSGSATTAHAVMKLNAEDGGSRVHIQIQLPEYTDDEIFKTIADISKERIRRAGKKIQEDYKEEINKRDSPLDTGFRVYKLTSSNFGEWNEEEATEDPTQAVMDFAENKKSDSTHEDLLTEIMLLSRVPLDVKILKNELNSGGWVFVVDGGNLVAYVSDEPITIDQATEIANMSPGKFVALDSAFNNNDAIKINIANICKEKHVEFRTI